MNGMLSNIYNVLMPEVGELNTDLLENSASSKATEPLSAADLALLDKANWTAGELEEATEGAMDTNVETEGNNHNKQKAFEIHYGQWHFAIQPCHQQQ